MSSQRSTRAEHGVGTPDKGGATHFRGNVLVGAILQQELDHFQVILLRCHVQRRKAFLQTQNQNLPCQLHKTTPTNRC